AHAKRLRVGTEEVELVGKAHACAGSAVAQLEQITDLAHDVANPLRSAEWAEVDRAVVQHLAYDQEPRRFVPRQLDEAEYTLALVFHIERWAPPLNGAHLEQERRELARRVLP